MSSTRLTDGRVLHFPATPFHPDAAGIIEPMSEEDLAAIVPLIASNEINPFTKRNVDRAWKRRFEPRYAKVNRSRLLMARLCIDRMLAELPEA